jgi:cysteinyl-tRNA synthetase
MDLSAAGNDGADAGDDKKLAELLERRGAARTARDWAAADKIRDELASLGWKIVDAADGPRLEKT